MISGISIAALTSAVISMAESVGRVLLRVLLFFAICAVFWPILPADPFRDMIVSFAAAIAPYAEWINLIVPVPFIVSSMAFYAAYRYAFWLYRHAADTLVQGSTVDV